MPLGTSFEETQIILKYRSISLEKQLEIRNSISEIIAQFTIKTKPIDLYINDYHYCTMCVSLEEGDIILAYRDLSRKGQLEIIEIFGLTEKLDAQSELRKKFPGKLEGRFIDPKRSQKKSQERTQNKIQSNNQYPSLLHQFIAERESRKK